MDDIEQKGILAREVCTALVDGVDEEATYAAGRLLIRLATTSPDVVLDPIERLADPLVDGDEIDPVFTEYACYCALEHAAADRPALLEKFEGAITTTVRRVGSAYRPIWENTDDSNRESIAPRALRRAGTSLAATMGLSVYTTALETVLTEPTQIAAQPSTVATFLLTASAEDHTEALRLIETECPSTLRAQVFDSLIEKRPQNPTAHRRQIASLDSLAQYVSESALHEDAFDCIRDATTGDDPGIRANAIDALQTFVHNGIISADKILPVLEQRLDDAVPKVRTQTVDAFTTTITAASQPTYELTADLAATATDETHGKELRCGATEVLGAVGGRLPNVREVAVEHLVALTDDSDRHVRQAAVEGLSNIAVIAPAAIASYEQQVVTLADDSNPDISTAANDILDRL